MIESKNKFLALSSEQKIKELIKNAKQSLVEGGSISLTFYLFDNKERLFVIPIENKFLLRDTRTKILRNIVKSKIKELREHDVNIKKVLFLQEGFYNKNHPNKKELDIDNDFSKENADNAFIAIIENFLEVEVRVYDCIQIFDDGHKISVLSENPIDNLRYCKIDPEHNFKFKYTNLL